MKSGGRAAWSVVAQAVGFGLMLPIGYMYVVIGLVVPAPVLLPMWVAWAAIVAWAVRNRDRALVVLGAPALAAALWLVVVFGGGELFGWQA